MTIPWTQLEGTALWDDAKRRHDADDWRRYHAFGHPIDLYGKAEALGIAYCPALDAGILTHDVIVTGDAPERSSWSWLRSRQDYPDATTGKLILSTAEHRPCADNRLIILDLSGFLSDDERRANTEALRVEKELQHGCCRSTFDIHTRGYLTGLAERISEGMSLDVVPPSDRELLDAIRGGILKTIDELGTSPAPHI